ncbi:MAG: hypothetical protein OEY64_00555 [Nitrospinota bacterium]|nr:hypothetical protein [Nitrospinota bacterium]
MTKLFIPAIHLPNGRDLFRMLPYTPSDYKKVLKGYGERSLLESTPEDFIALAAMPEEAYLDFLLSAGMGTQNIILCPGRESNIAGDILADKEVFSQIEKASEKCTGLSFYIHLEEENEIAEKLARKEEIMHPALTRMFNRYYFLIRICEDLDIELNESVQLRSGRFLKSARRLLEEWGKIFVRGNESVGGMHAFAIDDEANLRRIADAISRNVKITRYFVSRYMNVDTSWNVQFLFDDSGYTFYGSSRQIVSGGTAHVGNEGGAGNALPDEVLKLCTKIADRLGSMGAKGLIGIDVMSADGKLFPAEINARRNTSTPALCLYERLARNGVGENLFFRVMSLDTPGGTGFNEFAGLIGKENLFDIKSARGLIPYHFASSRVTGKIDAVFFSDSKEELNAIVMEVSERLE